MRQIPINSIQAGILSAILAVILHTAWAADTVVYEYDDNFDDFGPSASRVQISILKDLKTDALMASKSNIPIMIEFGASWCEYCWFLEEEVLKPMLLSEQAAPSAIIRKVIIDEYGKFYDLDGSEQSMEILEDRYNVDFYPTLVFIDGSGRDLGVRIQGVGTLDYIEVNINEAIRKSTQRMRADNPD